MSQSLYVQKAAALVERVVESFKTCEHGLLIVYLSLIFLAVLPIYLGSWECLIDTKREHDAKRGDRLSANEAYLFPLIGSLTLFSFYLAFKYLDKAWLNLILTGYFVMFGAGSVGSLVGSVLERVLSRSVAQWHAFKFNVLHSYAVDKWATVFEGLLTWPLIVGVLLASALATFYVLTLKHWMVSDLFSLGFAISAISLLHLDSFGTGIVLLSGLFFYDIFWVFGTDVMVSVAKNFDAPVKLLFPKDVVAMWQDGRLWPNIASLETVKNTFSGLTPTDPAALKEFCMLGLGDIVIPGVFIALCLRFDDARGHKWKPYFRTTLAAYTLGLVMTIIVMHTFKAAQPALLYLSPACILSSLGVAMLKGELKPFFEFSTEKEATIGHHAKDKKDSIQQGENLYHKKHSPVKQVSHKSD